MHGDKDDHQGRPSCGSDQDTRDAEMTALSQPAAWDTVAEGYDMAARGVFDAFALAALEAAPVLPGDEVADIACGPGTLATLAADRGARVTAVDFSDQMLSRLRLRHARERWPGFSIHLADGQALPFPDASFDAAFSLFGLMFFPNRAKGYAELRRTLRPGGRACISSWSSIADCSLFAAMADAMGAILPSAPQSTSDIASLENPEVLAAEMIEAGFDDVQITRAQHDFEFASPEQFWDGLVAGSAPVAMAKARMTPADWDARQSRAIDRLRQTVGPFPARLGATAWIGIGRRPQ